MKNPSKSGAEENTFIKAYEEIEQPQAPLRDQEAYPLLEIVHGPKQGTWYSVAHQKELTLGRAASNNIVLEDNSVSRAHAVFQAKADAFTVRDIGSRNGTLLNGKKIQGEVSLNHLDAIKVGIYTLRFLEEPSDEAFELEDHTPRVEEIQDLGVPPGQAETEAAAEEPLTEHEAKLPQLAADEEKIPASAVPPLVVPAPAVAVATKAPASRGRKNFLILLVLFGVLAGAAYLAYRSGALTKLRAYFGEGKTKTATQDKNQKLKVLPPVTPERPKAGQEVPVFIEADAKPIPAKIFYKGKELGQTPFKVSVQAPVGQAQELSAEFFLENIGEKWVEKQSFQIAKQDEVIPATFTARVGQLKVTALPKNGTLYLEGKFQPGQNEAKPIKIANLSFGQPVLLPFGSYVAEIRQTETLDGSSSTVNAVKYRREFQITPQAPEFTIEAPDQAVNSFPAQINSNPPGADLLVDGKKMGATPFSGNLPTGRHQLVLKKEGFNDFEKELSIELNTPYSANFNLATSPAGELINKGRQLIKAGQYNEAIEKLAEALKRGPEPTELAQIHITLGQAFIKTKNYDQALAYFQRAKESPEYDKQADLGMAEAYSGLGQNDQALIRLVNITMNTKDEKIRSDAETLYHKLYPMKSVLYIVTEPAGAALSVNGNPIGQATPVILSDLTMGSYRVNVQKDGFKTFESRVTLPLSAIKSLAVKLESL